MQHEILECVCGLCVVCPCYEEWSALFPVFSLQWNAVALWAWDIVVDNCAICRNHIMDLCK